MKHHQFILRIAFLSLLMSYPASAFADTYSATRTYTYGTQTFSTYQSACAYSDIQTHYVTVSYQWINSMWACVNAQGGLNAYVTRNLLCPYGGTLSGTSCIDAPACPTGQARDVTGQCKAPVLECAETEYDNGTDCVPVPDCNADSPNGGNFFNKVTKQCETVTPITICIGDATPLYCPPIDDCKPSGYICSNDPQTVADAQATRDMQVAASKALAEAKKAQIEEIAKAAATAAEQKANSVEGAKSSRDAASAALDAAKASGDQAAISTAITEFAKANQAVSDALARQINSESSRRKAEDIDRQAGHEVDQIPPSNPGNADARRKNVDDLYPSAVTSLNDAVSGDGNGTGRGTGISTSTGPSTDTSGLATDATAQGILGAVNGILDGLNSPDPFSAGGNVHGDGKSAGKGAISSVLCQGDCGSSPSCTTGSCSPSERIEQLKSLYSFDVTASGECPPINIDLSSQGWGSHSVRVHCELMESVRGSVSVIMSITIAIGFIVVLMSA